jgi:hypothetical protein
MTPVLDEIIVFKCGEVRTRAGLFVGAIYINYAATVNRSSIFFAVDAFTNMTGRQQSDLGSIRGVFPPVFSTIMSPGWCWIICSAQPRVCPCLQNRLVFLLTTNRSAPRADRVIISLLPRGKFLTIFCVGQRFHSAFDIPEPSFIDLEIETFAKAAEKGLSDKFVTAEHVRSTSSVLD